MVGDTQLLLQSGALSLNQTTSWTDEAELSACIKQVDALAANTDPVAMVQLARRAIALHQGDFLPADETHPEFLQVRHRLRATFLRQVGTLSAALETRGDHEAAMQLCSRVLERAPLAEEIARRLLRCLLALGRRAEAYRAFRQQLAALLGVQPAAETQALAASLLEP